MGQALVGHYRAPDLDSDARVEFDGDSLQLKVFGGFGVNLMTLEAFSTDVFGWKAVDETLPLRGVLTVERVAGQVAGFRVDTSRSRHIWFERRANATSTARS